MNVATLRTKVTFEDWHPLPRNRRRAKVINWVGSKANPDIFGDGYVTSDLHVPQVTRYRVTERTHLKRAMAKLSSTEMDRGFKQNRYAWFYIRQIDNVEAQSLFRGIRLKRLDHLENARQGPKYAMARSFVIPQ